MITFVHRLRIFALALLMGVGLAYQRLLFPKDGAPQPPNPDPA